MKRRHPLTAGDLTTFRTAAISRLKTLDETPSRYREAVRWAEAEMIAKSIDAAAAFETAQRDLQALHDALKRAVDERVRLRFATGSVR